MSIPFYDPEKSYEENFDEGPFGIFADREVLNIPREKEYNFLGFEVNSPFGIPAGPLLNGKFVKSALDKGFDICVYKTVRSRKYACHPWPNVLNIKSDSALTPEKMTQGVVVDDRVVDLPRLITNSFGVPSYDPEFWQRDLRDAVGYAKSGQLVVGSFQGTSWEKGNAQAYIKDFALCAKLLKETGVKIIEVNLSCPNEGSAHLLCFDTNRAEEILKAIKEEIGDTPLIAKIAYFEDENTLKNFIIKTATYVGAYSSVNTLPAKVFKPDGTQALPGEGRSVSGLCGPDIKWAGLSMVKKLKKIREELGLKYQIIGVGGVASAEDFIEYRDAGADAVMSATGAMWNPNLAKEIKEKIS